jgi:hypothetical protein
MALIEPSFADTFLIGLRPDVPEVSKSCALGTSAVTSDAGELF